MFLQKGERRGGTSSSHRLVLKMTDSATSSRTTANTRCMPSGDTRVAVQAPRPLPDQDRGKQQTDPAPGDRPPLLVGAHAGDIGEQDRHPDAAVGDVGIGHQDHQRNGQRRTPSGDRVDETRPESGEEEEDELEFRELHLRRVPATGDGCEEPPRYRREIMTPTETRIAPAAPGHR